MLNTISDDDDDGIQPVLDFYTFILIFNVVVSDDVMYNVVLKQTPKSLLSCEQPTLSS